jgi:multiple sugar transport system substrate-binding protein
MLKHRSLKVMILILAIVSLISVNFVAAQDEQITLTFSGWIGMEEATQSLLEEMIAGFEAEHPNVNIEYIGYPWADQYNQLVLAVAGGNAPDIAQIDINFPGLFELGAFEPLTPYFSEDEINDLIPAARDGGTFRGELVAWPWRTGTIQLIYNPVLLEQAGLPARAPETLEELRDWAIAVDQLGDDIYGLGMTVNRSPWTAYFYLPFMWAFNADVFNSDGNVIVNSPESVEAMNYFADLVEQGAIPVGSDVFDFRALFAQGKLGFYLDAPLRGTLRQMSGQGEGFDNQIGATPMPVGPSGSPESSVWGHWLAVFRTSQHKEEAIEFIKYITTNEAIVREYGEQGAIPASLTQLEQPMFQDSFIQAYLTGLETARSVPGALKNSGNFLQALDALSIAMSDVVLNGADPQTALDQAAQIITVIYPGTTIAGE